MKRIVFRNDSDDIHAATSKKCKKCKVVEKGVALEVNTSSADLISDYMPPREIIKKYFDIGGRMITLGSDAHIPQNASKDFEAAVSFLKATGFESIYYYKNRKPVEIQI